MIIDKFSHVCFHIFKFLLLRQYVLMKFTTSDSDKKKSNTENETNKHSPFFKNPAHPTKTIFTIISVFYQWSCLRVRSCNFPVSLLFFPSLHSSSPST